MRRTSARRSSSRQPPPRSSGLVGQAPGLRRPPQAAFRKGRPRAGPQRTALPHSDSKSLRDRSGGCRTSEDSFAFNVKLLWTLKEQAAAFTQKKKGPPASNRQPRLHFYRLAHSQSPKLPTSSRSSTSARAGPICTRSGPGGSFSTTSRYSLAILASRARTFSSRAFLAMPSRSRSC